jgi:hypothetical protein
MNPITSPRGWDRADIERDRSWAVRLTAAQIADFEQALAHAVRTRKQPFEMTRTDFPIGGDASALLRAAIGETQIGRGFQLLRGFPVQKWSVDEVRTLFWGIGLHLGVARPQGKASLFMADVRDTGTDYRSNTGRGYSSRSALDFHADGSDLVGLMCIRTGKSGGSSLISSSVRACNEMLATDPELVRELCNPFTFSRQGEQAPEEPPYYQASVFGWKDGRFACRHVRNHINTAQRVFPEVPRLTDKQVAALDLLDATLAREDLFFQMEFEPGDVQLINNYIVLHSRTDYEDFNEPERKRHLLRLWIALPQSQALPDNWLAAYKDVAPAAVRGGFRGQNITPEIRAFEQRLAAEHGMRFDIYRDLERHLAGQAQPQPERS